MTEKYFPNKRAIFIWTLVCEESGRGPDPLTDEHKHYERADTALSDALERYDPRLLSNNTVRK